MKAQDLLLPPGGGGGAGASPAEPWLPARTAARPVETRDDLLLLPPGGGGGAGESPAELWLPPGTAAYPVRARDLLPSPGGGGGAGASPAEPWVPAGTAVHPVGARDSLFSRPGFSCPGRPQGRASDESEEMVQAAEPSGDAAHAEASAAEPPRGGVQIFSRTIYLFRCPARSSACV